MDKLPEFSAQQLRVLEESVKDLNHRLQLLQQQLGESSAPADLEPKLAEVNRQIKSLRQQWRALLELPPAK